ncbi:MAG: envelope stress response membrane protein PspB [Gammaproteobacteria bacterium]|nr:envelope stress response membrane protein PspB [Gammaproteobacteria bacterium]
MIETLAIISLVVIVPLAIILHYVTKWKQTGVLSGEDEKMLQDLWDISHRMESRVNTLETILDEEIPDWRSRA